MARIVDPQPRTQQAAPLLVEDPPAASALQVAQPASDFMAIFERFASNPGASVETFERLAALWERNEANIAKAAFNAAMSAAQNEMRPVAADASNPQTKSRYASYEALDKALRPIYTKHGFGLSFDTGETTLTDHVRLLCYATHAGGHDRTYHIDMPSDGKGAKGGDVMTKTHATGSAVSYGMRYLLKMIFNVAVGEDDDDGNRAGRQQASAPKGYDSWWTDMEAVAAEGLPKLMATFQKSNPEFKTFLVNNNRDGWKALQEKARVVKAS
jgi:hypothetical protein